MKSGDILNTMKEGGLIPVFYHDDGQLAEEVVHACYEGGCRIFEFTNRGKEALNVFEKLADFSSKNLPDLYLGAGTIMSVLAQDTFRDLGAAFTVSPVLHTDLLSPQHFHIPGCGSPTEIDTAQRHGATLIKLFPANVLGPGFIRSIHGPMPGTLIMPSGGVQPEKENLKTWFDSGACCVGMGSSLFTSEIISSGNMAHLRSRVSDTLELIKNVRNG